MNLWGRFQNLLYSILSTVGKNLYIIKDHPTLPFPSVHQHMLLETSHWQIIVIDHKLGKSTLIKYCVNYSDLCFVFY